MSNQIEDDNYHRYQEEGGADNESSHSSDSEVVLEKSEVKDHFEQLEGLGLLELDESIIKDTKKSHQ